MLNVVKMSAVHLPSIFNNQNSGKNNMILAATCSLLQNESVDKWPQHYESHQLPTTLILRASIDLTLPVKSYPNIMFLHCLLFLFQVVSHGPKADQVVPKDLAVQRVTDSRHYIEASMHVSGYYYIAFILFFLNLKKTM